MKNKYLIKISGTDAPGITAAISLSISQHGARILDIEQAVTHGLLSLMILVELDEAHATSLQSSIQEKTIPFKIDFAFSKMDGDFKIADPADRFVLTLLGAEIPAQLLAEVSSAIAQTNSNIDSLRKLSASGLNTIEVICSNKTKVNLSQVADRLLAVATKFGGIDIALQKENLYRRSKRLVVFDMDSTLIQGEVIDELAHQLGIKDEVAAITKRAMNGELDFQESLIRRVGLLKGLSTADLDTVYAKIELTQGADRLIKVLKLLGYKIAIISGGFTYFVDRLKNRLGAHYGYANTLEMEDEKVTGRVTGMIVDARRKADLLELLAQQEGVGLDQVIAVGDGANDIQMLKKAGLGIAFNAKNFTKAVVGTSITHKSMDSILYLLGITDRDIKEMGIK